MKVQRKHLPNETYEVLEESPSYFIIKGTNTFGHVVPKADYEPVEEWVDVDMSTLTFKESEDDAYLCDDGRTLFRRTAWANGKGHGAPTDVYRITGLQRKVKR